MCGPRGGVCPAAELGLAMCTAWATGAANLILGLWLRRTGYVHGVGDWRGGCIRSNRDSR